MGPNQMIGQTVSHRELTDTQARVLDFVCDQVRERGFPPSTVEICDHFGWRSTNNTHGHLVAIERKGYIARERGVSRGIKLLPKAVELMVSEEHRDQARWMLEHGATEGTLIDLVAEALAWREKR